MSSWTAFPNKRAFSFFTYALCGIGLTAMRGLNMKFGFRADILTFSQFSAVLFISAVLHLKIFCIFPRTVLTVDALLLIGMIFEFSLTFPWQVQAFAMPLRDEAVHAFDLALGFNHAAYMNFLNNHPKIVLILVIAYKSFIPQVAFLVFVLFASGQIRELDRYMSAFFIAIALTSVISAIVPTVGVAVFLDPALAHTPAWPHWGTDIIAYRGLRDGAVRDLGAPVLGIISFPSFHAIAGILTTWGARSFKRIFAALIALNSVMLIATISCGGHYVADVLAGFVVAAASLLLARIGSNFGYALMAKLSVGSDENREAIMPQRAF